MRYFSSKRESGPRPKKVELAPVKRTYIFDEGEPVEGEEVGGLIHSAIDAGQKIMLKVDLARNGLYGNDNSKSELEEIQNLVYQQAKILRRARRQLATDR